MNINPLFDDQQLNSIDKKLTLIHPNLKEKLYKEYINNIGFNNAKFILNNDLLEEIKDLKANKNFPNDHLITILELMLDNCNYINHFYNEYALKKESPLKCNPLFINTELEYFNEITYNYMYILRKEIYYLYLLEQEEHLRTSILCNEIYSHLNSETCKKLCIYVLAPLIDILLKDKEGVSYFYEDYYYRDSDGRKHNYFKMLYDKIVFKKEKYFIKMNSINDFAQSWLMYLHH